MFIFIFISIFRNKYFKILNNDSLFELNSLIYTNVSEAFIINLKFSFLFINIIFVFLKIIISYYNFFNTLTYINMKLKFNSFFFNYNSNI